MLRYQNYSLDFTDTHSTDPIQLGQTDIIGPDFFVSPGTFMIVAPYVEGASYLWYQNDKPIYGHYWEMQQLIFSSAAAPGAGMYKVKISKNDVVQEFEHDVKMMPGFQLFDITVGKPTLIDSKVQVQVKLNSTLNKDTFQWEYKWTLITGEVVYTKEPSIGYEKSPISLEIIFEGYGYQPFSRSLDITFDSGSSDEYNVLGYADNILKVGPWVIEDIRYCVHNGINWRQLCSSDIKIRKTSGLNFVLRDTAASRAAESAWSLGMIVQDTESGQTYYDDTSIS